MSTIERPTKTYGTRKFVSEVAAAPGNYAPILSAEVDADIDTIFNAWNLGVDTVNVKDNSVSTAKLQDLAVTTTKLADGSVTSAKIQDNSISTNDLANGSVTVAKIQVGQTAYQTRAQAVPAGAFVNSPSGYVTFVSFPALVMRGGLVMLFGNIGWRINMSIGNYNVVLVWLRSGTIVQAVQYNIGCNSSCQVPLPVPQIFDWPGAGTFTYVLQVAIGGSPGCQVITDASFPGYVHLIEFA